MKRLLSASIPQQLYRPEQVRAHEARAAELAGVDLWQLMQRAGKAVFECLCLHYPAPLKVAVLCGTGNNGGDGYITAAHAVNAGYSVRVFAVGEPKTEDAKQAQRRWLETGGLCESLDKWCERETDIVIDALLGTGLQNKVRGVVGEAISRLGKARLPVISVDIPSGLDADNGIALGDAVRARHTVALVALKRGLYTGQAGDYTGKLHFADLGVLNEFRGLTAPATQRLDLHQLWQALPARPWHSHKGNFGHVVVIGGAKGMSGAVLLSGLAALRTGAGKVTIICEPGQESGLTGYPELMVQGLASDSEKAHELTEQADVIAIGPGLGTADWGKAWWTAVSDLNTPLVTDADALNLLAQRPSKRNNWILTPHPGEAGRLLGTSAAENEQQRWRTASDLHKRYGGVVVLKGAGTIVQGDEYLAVNTTGNPGLASAGMGDTLTGIIAGLVAQQARNEQPASLAECAGLSVLIHGAAADSAAQGKPRGLIATDVIAAIRDWVNPQNG